MLHIQSPTFSNFSKAQMASPLFRNKRVPSVQETYLCHWNRTNSCKKIDSPCKMEEKNRKRSHNSQQRVKSKANLSHNMAEELNTLKNQYMSIKTAYQELILSKIKQDDECGRARHEAKKFKEESQRLGKENEMLRNKTAFLEIEIERIKKQSMKLIEIEQFKSHKLEQNLLEKEKAISSIMESFKLSPNVQIYSMTTNDEQPTQHPNSRQQPNRSISQLSHFESYTLSKDKTLTNSQFISISLTSMMDNQSISTRRNPMHQTDKSRNEPDLVVMANVMKVNKENKENKENKDKQNEVKINDNFKKFRKQLAKKIEVNIDERAREVSTQPSVRTPLDRKNSKSNKSSKARLRRQQQAQNRSSKKKIMHK